MVSASYDHLAMSKRYNFINTLQKPTGMNRFMEGHKIHFTYEQYWVKLVSAFQCKMEFLAGNQTRKYLEKSLFYSWKGGGSRIFQILSHLGGRVRNFLIEKGNQPEKGGGGGCHFFITLQLNDIYCVWGK